MDDWNGFLNAVGGSVSIRFVVFEECGAFGTAVFVETNRQVIWFFPSNYIEKGIYKSKYGRGVLPFAVDNRISDKGVVASKNQSICIEKEKTFLGIHEGFFDCDKIAFLI